MSKVPIKNIESRLLKYAKEKYPEGTKIRSIHKTKKEGVIDNLEVDDASNIYVNAITDKGNITVFRDGKWAEIISSPEESTKLKAFTGKFKIGDKVKILREAEDQEGNWGNDWAEEMDKHIGKIAEITKIHGDRGYKCESDGDSWCYPEFILELVEDYIVEEITNKFKTGDYVVLDSYGIGTWHSGNVEQSDWAKDAGIPLNTKLKISHVDKTDIKIKGYPSWHPGSKFRRYGEKNVSASFEIIDLAPNPKVSEISKVSTYFPVTEESEL